jgi:putative transposase
MRQEKDAVRPEKLQVLYGLQTQMVDSVLSAAVRLGKHRTTMQRWLTSDRSGGITELLSQKPGSGRPKIMKAQTREKLEKELSDPLRIQ